MTITTWVLLYVVYAFIQSIFVVKCLNDEDGLNLGVAWVLLYIFITPLVSVAILMGSISRIIELMLGIKKKEG